MRLLENVYGKDTSAQTVATVMDLGKKIGKVGRCPISASALVVAQHADSSKRAKAMLKYRYVLCGYAGGPSSAMVSSVPNSIRPPEIEL